METSDINEFTMRTPFVPFEFWLVGGFRVPVQSVEFISIGRFALSFTVFDSEGLETFFINESIIALRTLQPAIH